jgi:hypothetical protein
MLDQNPRKRTCRCGSASLSIIAGRNQGPSNWQRAPGKTGYQLIYCNLSHLQNTLRTAAFHPSAQNSHAGDPGSRTKIAPDRGPHGQVVVRGVEARRNPKAVARPPSRMTTKYGAICAAIRRAGANFPHFVVARRSKILHIRRSSLLELRKIGSQRRPRESS